MNYVKYKKRKYDEDAPIYQEIYNRYTNGNCYDCNMNTKLIAKPAEGTHRLSDYSFWRFKGLQKYEEELKSAKYICHSCARDLTEEGKERKRLREVKIAAEKAKMIRKEEFRSAKGVLHERRREIFESQSFCRGCSKDVAVGFYLKERVITPNNHSLRDFDYWSGVEEEEYSKEFEKYDILCQRCARSRPPPNPKNQIILLMKERKYCQCGYCHPPNLLSGDKLKVEAPMGKITDYFSRVDFLDVLNQSRFMVDKCAVNKALLEKELKDAQERVNTPGVNPREKEMEEEKIKNILNKRKLHNEWHVQKDIR